MDEEPKKELAEDLQNNEEDESKPIAKLDLTNRDIAVFRFVHEHRYLIYNQIRRAFWKDRNQTAKACYKRIERLVNSSYLKKGYSKRKGLDLYFVTEKSLKVLEELGLTSGLTVYKPTEHFERFIDHDLKVTDLRIFFRERGLDAWTSERILRERDHLKRIPDGVINLRGKKIAIEFENFLWKSMERFQDMFTYYRKNEDYFLLFLIINGDVKDWLVRALDYDVRQVWIISYKELLKKKEEALFENKATTFALRQLL